MELLERQKLLFVRRLIIKGDNDRNMNPNNIDKMKTRPTVNFPLLIKQQPFEGDKPS